MKYNFKITNPEIFEEKVESLDINVDGSGHGDVVINGNCITGTHGKNDYQKSYGFILSEPFFYIIDFTNNVNRPYIDENYQNTGDFNNALTFETKQQAKELIEEKQWELWAHIEEFINKSF